MADYTYISDIETRLQDAAAQSGLKAAITDHLAQIAGTLPGSELPNGMSVEAAADEIIAAADSYVANRDAQMAAGAAYTDDEVRDKIAENLQHMTMEDAAAYLAQLQLVYRHMDPSAGGVTREALEAEYQQLRSDVAGKPLQAQVDELVDALQPDEVVRFINLAEDEDLKEAAGEDERISAAFSKIRAGYASREAAAIRGAALYGEAVQGRIEGADPAVDPGFLTARAAAYTDVAVTSAKIYTGEITGEEAAVTLSIISKALAAAICAALCALYLYGGLIVSVTLGLLVLELSSVPLLGSIVGVLVMCSTVDDVFEHYGDVYNGVCSLFRGMKKCWNKHIGSRNARLYIPNKAANAAC